MNKDEILAKSRNENKNGDEREKKVREHAFAMSAAWGGLICMLAIMAERLIFDRSATIIWTVYCGMQFANALTGAIQSKERKYILLSVLFGVLLITFVAVYLTEGFR